MHSHSFYLLLAASSATLASAQFGPSPNGWGTASTLAVKGTTGVAAMQLVVTTEQKFVVIDKIEANPLKKGNNSYWAAEIDIASGKIRPLPLKTNSFCAGGSFIKDGTLVSLGGDPYSQYGGTSGMQSIRTFKPCDTGKCQFSETQKMLANRWYPSTTRIQDGSIIIMGGRADTTRLDPSSNIEFYPRKGNAVVPSQFLQDSLTWNLFPHAILLPTGNVLVIANNMAMIYDWQKNKETRLPNLPDNLRTCYPFGSASALLPLKSANNWQAEVLLCGGSSITSGQSITTATPAIAKCYRMVITTAGISAGWASEAAPDNRIMGNLVLTPDGKIIYVNGAGTGSAGFYNTRQSDGSFSSAKQPRKTPYLYDPDQPAGKRWSSLGVSSSIPRMYHSVASLLGDGRIVIAGSSPVPAVDTSPQNPFPTEYRIEYLSPPYMKKARPSFTGQPAKIGYGSKFSLQMTIPSGLNTKNIIVSLQDLGFSTHGLQYNNRAVFLDWTLSGTTLTVTGPPTSMVYPPGPCWLYVNVDGVASVGRKLMCG